MMTVPCGMSNKNWMYQKMSEGHVRGFSQHCVSQKKIECQNGARECVVRSQRGCSRLSY